MFVYCILPDEILKCNFIKIGYCINSETLKKRYSTYYGSELKIYYVKVKSKNIEKYIHEELKKKGLHLRNELFIYNDRFNFEFYSGVLDEFDCNYNFYKCKQEHIFKFYIYISTININKKTYNIKKEDNEWKYYEKIESIIYVNNSDIEMIWSYYLLFCRYQFRQYYKNKEQFKYYIKSIFLNKENIEYKNCILEVKENEIKNTIINNIDFKDFILNKYNIIVIIDKKHIFEKLLDTTIYISRIEFLSLINNNNYYFPYINIYKIIIKDYGNNEINIIKYFDFNKYIKEYIQNKKRKDLNYLIEKKIIKKIFPLLKYKKDRNWMKLDILKDTGFVFN